MRVNIVKPLTVRINRTNGLTLYQSVERFKGISRVAPPPSRTPDQAAARNFLGTAKQAWNLCTASQKAHWSAFAQQQFTINRRDFPKTWRGIDAFSRSSVARQIAGLDPMPQVPEDDLPEGVNRMRLLPGTNARELAFTMQHDHGNFEGLALLVRLTPTGPTPGRNPYQRNLRHARGTGPQSVLPLPASGEVVRMPDVRFELQAGHRYAVELRVLRLADGAVSDAYYQVAIRQQDAGAEANAEVWTHNRYEDAAEKRRTVQNEYIMQLDERRRNAQQVAPGSDDGQGFQDDNVNVILLGPETHPQLWAWQDGYKKHFPQWNSMDYYKAHRTED